MLARVYRLAISIVDDKVMYATIKGLHIRAQLGDLGHQSGLVA